jgi:hypothetical protein
MGAYLSGFTSIFQDIKYFFIPNISTHHCSSKSNF